MKQLCLKTLKIRGTLQIGIFYFVLFQGVVLGGVSNIYAEKLLTLQTI